MNQFSRSIALWLVLGLMFLLLFNIFSRQQTREPEIIFSDFLNQVDKGQISEVTIQGNSIHGKSTSGEHFKTYAPHDPDLVKALRDKGVKIAAKPEDGDPWWMVALVQWFPMLLLVGVWIFFMRQMQIGGGKAMSFGKSRAKLLNENTHKITFADVAGIDEAKDELEEIIQFLKDPKKFTRLGGRIPKGVLLVGAPGTGKTLLARAIAGEAGVPFFSISGSDFVEMFVGVGAARVRDLFAQAQEKAPSIIFIDELDALGKARGVSPVVGGHDEREQTLNQLLAELDGFDTQKGVIILAATNRPEILDPALLRPGRFDRQVVLDRPDLKGREKILRVHVRDVKLAPGLDLAAVAAKTPGFVGADLANLVNEAALRAARQGKDAVDVADFDEAIDRVVAGIERKSRVINPKEKEIVAYHEAGHALVAESREHADRVAKVSVIPRGVAALGYTQQQPTEDRYLMTRAELLDRLDVLLGGRVAEELVFGDVSTGAQDDLQRATDIARHMVARYGMSEALGLATFEAPRQALFLNVPSLAQREYSEETARRIDAEIEQLLGRAHERVQQTLGARRATLEALAKRLIEKEVVDRAALTKLIADTESRPQIGGDRPQDKSHGR